jgi:hypothetical protein
MSERERISDDQEDEPLVSRLMRDNRELQTKLQRLEECYFTYRDKTVPELFSEAERELREARNRIKELEYQWKHRDNYEP